MNYEIKQNLNVYTYVTYAGSEKMNLPNENLGNCGSTYQMGTWVTVDEPGLSSQSLKDTKVSDFIPEQCLSKISKSFTRHPT